MTADARWDPRWDRLTQPAQAACQWAWIVTAARTSAAEPEHVRIDTLDLLAGMALAHLHDSPVNQLLGHFHIPAGAVLSNGGTRRYDADALLTAAARIPNGQMPPVDRPTNEVLEYALSLIAPSSDGLATLPMLFGALLETTNPASAALRAEFENRGVNAEPVVRSVREHLGMRTPYPEFLQDKLPYQPPEIRLPPYAPDEPRTRRPPKQPADDPPDLVGIRAEVNGFAYLIASKTLTPPLAIGLFGDWGSGKSYFLRSLQRRIDQLVTVEADDPPFYRAIAQIEFNAWQYVEGNLWASLLEHLFRNLRRAGEEDADDLLDARRREYLTKITERTAEHRRAAQRRDDLVGQHEQAQQAVRQKIDERDEKLAELQSARTRNPFAGWSPSRELAALLEEVKQRTGLGELGSHADELRQTLASTGETVRRSGPILGALRAGGPLYAIALIAVIALGPVASWTLSWLDVSAVSNVIGSLSALLAGITAYAARGNGMVSGALSKITEAQARLDDELNRRREEFDAEIRQAEDALAKTERALESAVIEEKQLAASVAELETELARITPSSVLAEFLGQRVTSDDYRRHLGVPALVRQDLERLSRLIQHRHESTPGQPGIPDEHAIDRIVLYIDDLDRCPTPLVIKVLEAVHLLLAFPLFVVVVAVDTRWLESSLREHYRQLDADAAADAAVPTDYLEKIFQVPFWVRPLDEPVRRDMMHGLLTPNLASASGTAGSTNGDAARVDVSQADLPYFTELVRSFEATTPPETSWLEAARLTVTGAELNLVGQVAPLISATPRAVKRFINIYLLLKSMGRGRGWPVPEHGQLALLLAIATGLPKLADQLLPRLADAEPNSRTLRALINDTSTTEPVEEYAKLKAWLADHPAWNDIPLSDTDRWTDLILRFRFTRTPANP